MKYIASLVFLLKWRVLRSRYYSGGSQRGKGTRAPIAGVREIKKRRGHMENIRKQLWIFAVIFVAGLTCLGIPQSVYGAQPEGYVTVSVEKFTIGQGYLIEPCRVPIYRGDPCGAVLERVLKDHGYTYETEYGFCLKGIYGADSGNADIPIEILNMEPALMEGETVWPPKTDAVNEEAPLLAEFSYGPTSGWITALNGVFLEDLSVVEPRDGDVVRLQYTAYGRGADLGGAYENITPLKLADKEALTKRIAQVNQEKDNYLQRDGFQEKYDQAMDTLTALVMEPEQWRVDDALEELDRVCADPSPESAAMEPDDQLEPGGAYQPSPMMESANADENVNNVSGGELAEEIAAPLDEVLSQTRDYILSEDPNPDRNSQWHIIGLARGGFLTDAYKNKFYVNTAAYIKEKEGVLSKNKYSEYSKMILSMTAIGKDARNMEGYNMLEKLADFSKVKTQGFNGPIWALIALNAHPAYEIPLVSGIKEQTTEEGLIQYLLAGEKAGGGWSLQGDVAEVDITAMTLQALAPYYQKSGYENVTAAIDRALTWLSQIQMEDGGFFTLGGSGTVANAESTCQVLTALSALGIDCGRDSRFIKDGKWTVNALLSYRKDGGFMHIREGGGNWGAAAGKVNGMATEQAFYALAAYRRMLNQQTALYDMSDVNLTWGNDDNPVKAAELKGKLNLKAANATTSAIRLRWNKIAGADGYKVYRYMASDKKYKEIAALGSGKTTYVFKKLAAGTSYKFRVTAYINGDGKVAAKKTETISAVTKPAKPVIKASRTTSRKAKISWNKAKGSSGYEIYMSVKKNAGYKKVKTVASAKKGAYTKTGLKPKKTYYFKIRTYKKVNGQKIYGDFSAVKTVKTVKKK